MKRAVLALVLLSVFYVDARSDDAAIDNVGGCIRAMEEHPTIRLVAEHVHARIFHDSVLVECVFFLRNEGPKTSVKMGFPDKGSGHTENSEPFEYFRSYVDAVSVVTECIGPEMMVDSDYRYWWVKEVPFEEGQTRVIRDVYKGKVGDTSIGQKWFMYYVITGRSWKGPIESISVVFTFEDFDTESLEGAHPPEYQKSENELRWSYHDMEPDEHWESVTVLWR